MEISLEDLKSAGKWFILICGGLTVVIPAIITFVAQKWSDYKNEKWRLNTEVKLKNLESELSEKTSLINNMIEVQKSNYSLSQEKRINYIEEIWGSISELNYVLPTSMINLFSRSDDNLKRISSLGESSREFSKAKDEIESTGTDEYIESYISIQKRLTSARPFLGEDLHQRFYVLYMFYTRIFAHFVNGIENKNLNHWSNDKQIIKVLKDALAEDEFKFITDTKHRNLTYITGILEGRIIEEINKVLSGNIATKTSIEHVKEIKELMELSVTTKNVD
ncbi:hypothetical protein [Chryseobacterium sp. 18068]|uniref:hypothetical protein n=1 Tax=Chryseobacterium sp. 18068 TaxID=2681414 RepID=UPI00135A0D11|nr:hypothetical protein [Chryseobacterium sp. 18068]